MGYKKILTTKIIRTIHEVTFYKGASPKGIYNSLDKIPSDSRLIWNDSYLDEETGKAKLVFIEEIEK